WGASPTTCRATPSSCSTTSRTDRGSSACSYGATSSGRTPPRLSRVPTATRSPGSPRRSAPGASTRSCRLLTCSHSSSAWFRAGRSPRKPYATPLARTPRTTAGARACAKQSRGSRLRRRA
ncbi:MAG: hypothetical protein AVDCRST_MAG78-752, partial [uncultured Rubrobacteraceae bacterium]